MILEDCGTVLSNDSFQILENEMNIKLPESYKKFMMEHNGGTPVEDLMFDFFDASTNDENNSDIREFYIFYEENNEEYDNIMTIYQIMKEEGQIGKEYFPIADDSGGNPICICVSGENYGNVYFCDHELEDAETGYLVMSKIADSFTEFIESLYVYADDEE